MIKKHPEAIISTAYFLLVLLWVYAASAKLIDFDQFRLQMASQVLPHAVSKILVYILPPLELGTAFLLIVPSFRNVGFYFSFFLLFVFTAYIGIVMTGVFGRVPCSCGGILGHMPWLTHLLFNCFYLLITIVAIILSKKERRMSDNDI
jgi:putative oxidoreductase